MTDITFVIPIAPYHEPIAQHAIWSAKAQTIPCEVVTVKDTEQRGAGWARNTGLAQVNTTFVVFLDADDTVERTFAERCLKAWTAGKYVYTDWFEGEKRVASPACAWVNSTWHVVTTLIPTAYVRAVGGFDETLSGGEDTDFYLKLMTRGYCGKRLPEALFHYSKEGQRGFTFVHSDAHEAIMRGFTEKYGGKQMSCCGGGTPDAGLDIPVGERQPGDVLAMALWGGNRQERGRITGRLYPRMSYPKTAWIAPQDVGARPDLWRVVEPEIEAVQPDGLDLIADYFRMPAPYQPEAVLPAKRADTAPNFARLTEAFELDSVGTTTHSWTLPTGLSFATDISVPVPAMAMSSDEINALRDGDTIIVTPKETVTRKRKRRSDSGTKRVSK